MSEAAPQTMSERAPVRGIVFSHGRVGEALVEAVRGITGCPEDALSWLSNTEGSPDVLRERLQALLSGGPTVVFADVRASSCTNVARLSCVAADPNRAAVVVGVNMPMLLDFVFNRDTSLPELVPRLVDRGRGGIEVTTP